MSVNRWKLFSMPVIMLGVASPLLVNCGSMPGGAPGPLGSIADSAGCPELANGDIGKIKLEGGAEVEGRVKGFLEASYALDKMTVELEGSLIAACSQLGKDLGMAEGDLKAEKGGGKGADKVCGAVSAKIDAMMKANAAAQITVAVDPPQCYVPVDFMTKCLGECGSPVDPGKLDASCEGGEISGKCDAQCTGKCVADAGAQCTGTCQATCEGKCEGGFKGTCGGKCDGKCDGKNTKGKCEGTCEGKCDAEAKGSCTATCDGKCTGSCEMKAAAKCEGRCSGGCSTTVKEPTCSGEFKPPQVKPECHMQCMAEGAAEITCAQPNVRVVAKGAVNADAQKLVGALQSSLPAIVKIQLGTGKRLQGAVEGVVKAGGELKDVAASAGTKALVCVGAAVDASASAAASVDVNVKASAKVSGSVKAGG